MPPPRYPTNPNTIKLVLDFDTLDRLKAAARARKVDTTRCAYELIQEALGARAEPPPAAAPDTEPDPFAEIMRRGLDAISKPRGTP